MYTGLIHIYCGDGKGKTTAAVGLAIRCAGRGGTIIFTQFLKSRTTGELAVLQNVPTLTVLRGKGLEKFTFQMTDEEKAACKAAQETLFEKAAALIYHTKPDMAVFDEVIGTCHLGMIDEKTVLQFLRHKPNKTEIVMTGRNPSQALLEQADYVSEIVKRKHPFDRGIGARIGIES